MEKKKVPEIRFEGFTDDWEQYKMGDIVDVCSGRDYKHLSEGDIPVYGTGGYMLSVNKALSYDRDAVGIGRKGTIDKPYILRAPFWTVDTLFYVLPRDYENIDFTFDIFQTIDWRKKDESTGVPSLSKEAINEIEIMIPSSEEQKKIGAYFKQLDNLITLHQHRYEKLKLFKEAMLDKMFPKNGEKVPEIRFKGFTDDWEQRKFGELVVIERGGSPRPIDKFITNDKNGLNWIKIGDAPEQGNYITKTKEKIKPEGLSKTREVHLGDLILSNSMSFGKPYIMGIDGCIHDGWLLIRDINKVFNLKYLCCMLGTEQMLSQYKAMAAGSTVNNLNKELVEGTKVNYPSFEEQTRIGDYFASLDHLIILHKHKYEKLKLFKEAMLNKMFI
ncbi:MAG: restriction endonuclease subunit S [Lachnospiraceae bacterium]|nr:restriction endonuclease subunit S [Lachnospiraceae bacterium]